MAQTKRRLCAMLLSAVMVMAQFPVVAMAETSPPEDGAIASFSALPDEVREQTVPIGTAARELNLPDTITAEVYRVTEAAAGAGDESGVGDAASPTEADSTDAVPAENNRATEEAAAGDGSESGDAASPAEADPPVRDSGGAAATVTTENVEIPVSWDSDPAYDGDVAGTYVFTARIEGYTLSSGASLPQITVAVEAPQAPRMMAAASGLVTGEGYTFDPATGKLTVTTNAGTTAWRTDANIVNLDQEYTARYAKVKSLAVDPAVTEIGEKVFEYCGEITSVNLNACVNLTTIGTSAFSVCIKLKSVYLAGCRSLTTIGQSAFSSSRSLTTVKLPDSLETIGIGAFYQCSLSTLEIPANVTSVNDRAFENSTLKNIVFLPETAPTIGNMVFSGISPVPRVYTPNGGQYGTLTDTIAFTLIIANHPQNTTSDGNSAVNFLVDASGRPPIEYKWQAQKPGSTSWFEPVNGEGVNEGKNYVIPNVWPHMNGWKFRCVLTSHGNTLTSNEARLTRTGITEVTGVIVAPATLTLNPGGTRTLAATVTPENATEKHVEWSSSNRSVATVNASGEVTAVANGSATITATTKEGGKTAQCTVTVETAGPGDVAVTGVTVAPTTLALNLGEASTLTATVAPDNATNKTVTWSSNNTGVATVNASTGEVTAVANGTATITATTADGGKTATCAVTVEAATVSVTGVTVAPTTLTLTPGGTGNLTATVAPEDATNKAVTWSSNNTSVATVNASTGLVTAVADGSATITATTTDGGHTATCAVNVSNLVVGHGYSFDMSNNKLTVTTNGGTTAWRTDARIGASETARYNAVLSVELGDGVTEIGKDAFYQCEEMLSMNALPAGVTMIGENAFSYCKKLPTVDLSACTSLTSIGNAAFSHCMALTSVGTLPDSLESIGDSAFWQTRNLRNANPSGLSNLSSIGSQAFRASGSTSGTLSNMPALTTLGYRAFEGSPFTAVDLSASTGLTSLEHGVFSGSSALKTITLPDGLQTIKQEAFSDCGRLTAIVIPPNVTAVGKWAFEDCESLTTAVFLPETAPTFGEGIFRSSISAPEHRPPVVYTPAGGEYGTLGITTLKIGPVITTQPENATVTVGATATFSITAGGAPLPALTYQWQEYKNGAWENIRGATSASYTTPAATMEMNGLRYRCMVTNFNGNKASNVVTLTVNAGNVPVTGVTVVPTTLTLNPGGSAALIATVIPATATNKTVTWSSNTPAVATVDASGVVTAVANGSATITATTADGGHTATCTVTVETADPGSVAVTGVTLDKNTLELFTNQSPGTATLTATVSPNNATNKAVSWTSNDPAVATVDASGVVTAVGKGSATITVTTQDGGKTAQCAVTVKVAVTGVIVAPTTLTLNPGGTHTLTATVAPANATNQTVTWSSSNTSVATVDASGVVTAVANGSATITATTADGGKTATCTVTVEEAPVVTEPVTGVRLNQTALTLYTNKNPQTATLTATVQPDNATNKTVSWASSNSGVATVDQAGKVTAVSRGTATITVTTADGGHTATCTVTVKTYTSGGGSSGGGSTGGGSSLPKNVYTITGDSINQSISRSDIKRLADSSMSLTISCEKAGMTFEPAALKAILAEVPATTDKITFTAQPQSLSAFPEAKKWIGSRPAYAFAIGYKDVQVKANFPAGSAAITLTYAPKAEETAGSLFMVYVNQKGAVTWLEKSSHANGKVLADVPYFAVYGVAYKAPAPAFTDTVGHWAKSDIEFVYARGLLAGTSATTFSPNADMTRGMFVTALGRLAGINPESYKTRSFTDVKKDAYYAPYVEWAAQKNIVKGTGNNLFSPDTPITREQMAVIMVNYASQMGYSIPATLAENTFADSASISAWAQKEVKAMQRAGIIRGKDGNLFDPQGKATRAEVSAVLRRFVEIVIDPATAQGLDINDSGSAVMYESGKLVKSQSRTVGGYTYQFNSFGEAALPTKKLGTYTVQPNDSFWRIAFKMNCTMADLERLNGKSRYSLIHPGDVLRVPEQ